MADDNDDLLGEEGWRNSLAPNDGYCPRNRRRAKASDRRSSSRLSRRNSSRISLDMFNNFAYGMMRHMRNPQPSAPDRFMYQIWRKVGVYMPLTGVLAIMDFFSDWMNSVTLMQQDICQEKIFGTMMFITLTALPLVYGWLRPNDNEMKYWEKIIRKILLRPALNPYEKWSPPKDDKLLYYISFFFYVLFSPITHVISQVMVHISHASKVDHYMEYKTRTQDVIKRLQEGQFKQFDEDELYKLKSLQHRATQYVMYYTKYAKSRLKFCLIEDAIQYNIQMALLIFTAFSPIRDVHRGSFDYSDHNNLGYMATYFGATPSTIRLCLLVLRVFSLFTSVLSMWIAMYQAERFHEILRTNKPISFFRIIAMVMKTIIEMLWPTLTVVLFAMDRVDIIPEADNCPSNILLLSVVLYCVFPLGYTFVSHLLWAFILNLSNCDDASAWEVLNETVSWSIYSACLTIKYSRIAGNDESTETEYYAKKYQYLILLGANLIKFALPTVLMLIGLPSIDLTPKDMISHHIGVFDSMSFKYEFEYPVSNLEDPVMEVLGFSDEWQFSPEKATQAELDRYSDIANPYGLKEEGWENVTSQLQSLITFGEQAVNGSLETIFTYKCEDMTFGDDSDLQLTFCVWGPRRISTDNTVPHFGAYASFGQLPANIDSIEKLDSADKQPNGQRIFEMRNERLVLIRHIINAFCSLNTNDAFNCADARYQYSFIQTAHQIMENDDLSHTSRMVNLYETLKTGLPPMSETASGVKTKLVFYMIAGYLLFTVSYILAEIDFPLVSKAYRYDFLARFYPYLLPAFLFILAMALTWMGIKKSTKTYCEMNPDSDKEIFFGTIELDCIRDSKYQILPDDEADKRKFKSLSKCGLGMVCKYCKGRTDCTDNSNWIRMEIESNEICIKNALEDYQYGLIADYVDSTSIGSIESIPYEPDDELTCYFDPELIARSPFGPNIDPMDCPQVVRRIFKGSSNKENEYRYKFGFLKPQTTRVQTIKDERKLLYGESDGSWKNVPQVFPQATKALDQLTYDEWLQYSWNELTDDSKANIKKELMTTDIPDASCLNAGEALIPGLSLYGNVEMKGTLLVERKRKYFLQTLIETDSVAELPEEKPEFTKADFDNLLQYTKTETSLGPPSDEKIEGYSSLLQRSLLILVDGQSDLVHRFHQPFEVPYFGYSEFEFEKYSPPLIDSDTDCTPDDIYSWDAPFEETNVTDCGTTMSINHFFGGKPGDRNYTIGAGNGADTHVGFHGCPALYNGKMMVFGAGPNMHDYMHEMYNEYYNTWQINRDRKVEPDSGCVSRIASQLTDYAKKFWQSPEGDPEAATFQYVAPLESYGQAPFNTDGTEPDIAGWAKCAIRHVGQSYSREYYGTNHHARPRHYTNKNIRSCQLQSIGKLDSRNTNEGWNDATSKKAGMAKTGYQGPNAVKFFFIDLTGDKVSKLSDWSTVKNAYTEKGFTHPQLSGFFNKFEYVLPVHGIDMDSNKLLTHLKKAAEPIATGQLIQAIIQNEGFDQIFSYLFNFKNCEKRDIQLYTNLYKAEVDTTQNKLLVDSIRSDLANTGYASMMRNNAGSKGSFIGSYKDQSYKRNLADTVAEWESLIDTGSASGRYLDNNEYSFYRWTYFFDYQEDEYNPGPEVNQQQDSRWSEETRLSNALLWLRDYDNSQSNRRELLKSSYMINRFSYPDSNQDGRKFIHGETHSEDAFSAFSPVAFAENPLSFVTPLRSERTDSANEMSSFVNDVMYTPQRWGVYPFKGVSMKYHQPVMEQYNPDLFNKTGFNFDWFTNPTWNMMVNHDGHFWNWTYQDQCGKPFLKGHVGTHWITTYCPYLAKQKASDALGNEALHPNKGVDGGIYGDYRYHPTSVQSSYSPGMPIRFNGYATQHVASSNDLPLLNNHVAWWPKMGLTNVKLNPNLLTTAFQSGYQWYWLNKTGDPVAGYLATTAKPHCFLASDHDIGGFLEPFYRNTTSGEFLGELNMTKYLEQNTWGQPNAIFRADDPYFKDDYKEGPLTIMMNKSMFGGTDAEFHTGIKGDDFQNYGWGQTSGGFSNTNPWKYGLKDVLHNNITDVPSYSQNAALGVEGGGATVPWLFDRDRWYRQCNFLKSLELLNYNLDNQQYSNGYQQFDPETFDDDFSVDKDGFLDAMLNLNKPCPIFDEKVWLFGRIRKTQEIRSRNTEEFNWNHLRQAGLHHSTAGKIMPLRLESDKWLNNDMWDKSVLLKYGNHLQDTYGVPLLNDLDHGDLGKEPLWSSQSAQPNQPYEHGMFEGFTHREVQNTIPSVWGMNITGGNEMYVPPVYGSNYGLSMFNDVEKTYPHPYTVSFTYDGNYAYRGMVPNSISPQWGACVVHDNRLVCLGGMICYHHARKNAAFTPNRVTSQHDDSLLCDNLDDAPHNIAISPKTGSEYEWETSLTNRVDLGKYELPIGLLGHSAIVIKQNGTEQIHVFGGMWGKMSNYVQFTKFYQDKSSKAKFTQNARRYTDLFSKEYMQTWDNSIASQVPGVRRSSTKFRPNQVWSPADVSYAITHNAVARLSLIYESGKGWTRGPQMQARRFGHTSIHYGGRVYHIGGHFANGVSNAMETWAIKEGQTENSRRKRSAGDWNEGIPYNPKPFLYDGWSYTNFDHDPTLQNYFFRNKQSYSSSSAIFKDQDGNVLAQPNGFTISDFFNGSFVNEFHGGETPFFENIREAYMSDIKYAPCKYCIFDSSFNTSDTTLLQSLANTKIYKWNAAIPPRKGQEWNAEKRSFDYMKFDINRMDSPTSSIFGESPVITADNAYFNDFQNLFPLVFNVPTKHVPSTFDESVSFDNQTSTADLANVPDSIWLPKCNDSHVTILPGISYCSP